MWTPGYWAYAGDDDVMPKTTGGKAMSLANDAFRKTVLPDIDQEKMKKVLEMNILLPEDFNR